MEIFLISLDFVKDLFYIMSFPHINAIAIALLWASVVFPFSVILVFEHFG